MRALLWCATFLSFIFFPVESEFPIYSLSNSQMIHNANNPILLENLFKIPLHFIANNGQMDESVVYYARSDETKVYCTYQGLVFVFPEGRFSMKFPDGKLVKPEARSELTGKVNYYIGSGPESWHENIPTFKEIVYREAYPGVDLVYSGDQKRLKYTFYVHPGAEPDKIQMIYDGIEGMYVDSLTGKLNIQTKWGKIRDDAPVAYQEINGIKEKVAVSFSLMGKNLVGFSIGDYNPDYDLIIDPMYSSYLGGNSCDHGRWITVDKWGNAYITGTTTSNSGFPTHDAYQSKYSGPANAWHFGDAYVTKISGDGNLVYFTYLGGSDEDFGMCIAVDDQENAFVTGDTKSPNFPRLNAIQNNLNGYTDAFITKFSSSGQLSFSTYLGGDGYDSGHAMAVDITGNVYVVGSTTSKSGFYVLNAYQSTFKGGSSDIFMIKISGSGVPIYSTYLGGNGRETETKIAVDSRGNAYITGITSSISGFPLVKALQEVYGGSYDDGFVAAFSSNGSIIYSTYLGGSAQDYPKGIGVDSQGNAYIGGEIYSKDKTSSGFPTKNAFQSSYGGEEYDGFVTCIANDGKLIYSSYLGGKSNDHLEAIAVDSSGNAYVTGSTYFTDPPTFPIYKAFQSNHKGEYDAFITRIASNGSLIYSTYLGGTGSDRGYGIAVDSLRNAYVAGSTRSNNFPITMNAFQKNYAGGPSEYDGDFFAARLSNNGSLMYSTYLGGHENEFIWDVNGLLDKAIAVDDSGNAYVIGNTESSDFPLLNAFQSSYGGGNIAGGDIFVAKLYTETTSLTKELELKPGWNFISIPVLTSNNDLNKILQPIDGKYSAVYAYDNERDEWKYYFPNGLSFLNNLKTIDTGVGYWIKMNNISDTLTIEGADASGEPILLKKGRNLVGFNYSIAKPIEEAISSIASNCLSVWTFDPATNGWKRYIPGGPSDQNSLSIMEPGKVYMVETKKDCIWTIP